MQLHLTELRAILVNLKRDFPSFGEKDEYGDKCEKLEKLLTFRIQYFVGPLVNKSKSEFSWGEETTNKVIYPWNFEELIKQDERANAFIRRMTNFCNYLIGEEVLAKN